MERVVRHPDPDKALLTHSFEPYTSMLYARRVLSGDFQVVCPWLLRDLINLGLWDDEMKNLIIAAGGSIQNIPTIPAELKAIYKTVWEISQKAVIDLSADRGAFIDQSESTYLESLLTTGQSLNIHLTNPSFSQLTSMHFYGWKRGLKTGIYYLRTRPSANAIQFTIDAGTLKRKSPTPELADRSEAKANAAAAKPVVPTAQPVAVSAESLVAPLKKVSIATTASDVPVPSPSASVSKAGISRPDSPAGPSEEEEISYEEAKRRADERAEAALQCSIDNKEACMMCSG
jgi:ribonucleoside-diphosphate reductase subunit M1